MVNPAVINNPDDSISINPLVLLAYSTKHPGSHHHDEHCLILIISLIHDIIHLVSNTLYDIRQLQNVSHKVFCRKIQFCRGERRIPLLMILPERIYENNIHIISEQVSSGLLELFFFQMNNHNLIVTLFCLHMHQQRCFS